MTTNYVAKFDSGGTPVDTSAPIFDNGGMVGIGTTSPSYKLTVATDSSGDGICLAKGDGSMRGFFARAGGGYGFLELYDDSSTRQISLYSNGNSYIKGGNVGIGTTAPTSMLTVGSIGVNSSSNNYQFGYGYMKTDTSLRRAGTLAQSNEASQPFALYVAVQGATADANRVACLQTGNEGTNNLGNLALQAYGGNVGIGTTAPSNNLTVNTSGASCDGISLTKDGNVRGFLARAGTGFGFLELYDDSNTRQIKLYSALEDSYINYGNVGIGTTSPATSAKLELSSTTGALLLTRLTTTQRGALTAVAGMIIFNTTTGTFQGCTVGGGTPTWVNL